jgi:NTP pyrophosphatase (non-canonical NTP hydrolase)
MIHDKLDPERGKAWKPSVTAAELAEKAREIDDIVKRLEESSSSRSPEDKETLALGLSDVLYVSFVLAEHHGIELEDSFMQAMNDYMLDFVK